MKIIKPWGHEFIWANTNNYIAKILFIKKNNRLSLQYHEIKEETIYVLSGILKVWDQFGECKLLKKGSIYHVEPMQIHRFGATDNDVQLIEVSTTYLNDIIRIADDYNRVNYEK